MRKRKLRFKAIVILLMLMSGAFASADELKRAADLEKDGAIEEAVLIYSDWLRDNQKKDLPDFGRILLHTMRLYGDYDHDLELVDQYLYAVQDEHDRYSILKTVLLLTELSGESDKNDAYYHLFEKGNFEFYLSRDDSFSKYIFNRNQVHEGSENAGISDSSDSLYKAYLHASLNDEQVKAEQFRKLLLSRYPQSIESAILKGNVQVLWTPESLLRPLQPLENTAIPEIESEIYYLQAGAFSSLDNARSFQNELSELNLDSRIALIDSRYKVIIASHDKEASLSILKSAGISAFQINWHP